MDKFNADQFVMMYMTTIPNHELIEHDPPQAAIDVDEPGLQEYLDTNAQKEAYRYDMYQEVIQLSFLDMERGYTHLLVCDELSPDVPQYSNEKGRTVQVVKSEQELIKCAVDQLSSYFQMVQGIPVKWKILAGWKIYSDIWPLFVNKAFVQRIALPQILMADPISRWSRVDKMLDVSTIYSQGMSLYSRKLPALADALKYWGFRNEDDTQRHPRPEQTRDAICENPIVAAKKVENYLTDMMAAVVQYYEGAL